MGFKDVVVILFFDCKESQKILIILDEFESVEEFGDVKLKDERMVERPYHSNLADQSSVRELRKILSVPEIMKFGGFLSIF